MFYGSSIVFSPAMDWQPVQHSPKPMDGLISVMTFVLWSRCCALNVHIIKKEKKNNNSHLTPVTGAAVLFGKPRSFSLQLILEAFWHLPPGLLPTGHAGNVEISELWGDVRIRWLFAPQSSFIPSTS